MIIQLLIVCVGLDHEKNLHKMRLLTFLQLSEDTPEMTFSFLETQLQLQPQQIEPFIIQGEKCTLVLLCTR